jgi:O-antigen/teichoic acid export membrane protein
VISSFISKFVDSSVLEHIKKFAVMAFFLMLAKSLSIVTQVILGRYGGAEFYGHVTIMLLLAHYFSLPMNNCWGVAYVRYIAATDESEILKHQALKMLFLIVITISIFICSVLWLFDNELSQFIDINIDLFRYSIALALASAWWQLLKQIYQSLQNWKKFIIVEFVWCLLVLLGTMGMFFSQQVGDLEFVAVFFAAYLVAGFPNIVHFYHSWKAAYCWTKGKELFNHGWAVLSVSLATMLLFGIDRLIINQTLGAEDVGVYQAHFLSTYGIISTFTAIVINYLFPLLSKGRETFSEQCVSMIIFWSYPFIIGISLLTGIGVVYLYGFDLLWELIVIFSLFNAFQFHGQLLSWKMMSQGRRSTSVVFYVQVIALLINVLVIITTISYIGMFAGGLALLVSAMAYLLMISRVQYALSKSL